MRRVAPVTVTQMRFEPPTTADTGEPMKALAKEKLCEIELTALRNEMREWQGRRFILTTIAVAFVGVAVGQAKERTSDPYTRTMAVFCVLWMLSMLCWYSTQATLIGQRYIRSEYPEFRWEARAAAARGNTMLSKLQLHQVFLTLYLVLGIGHAVFAYQSVSCHPCIVRPGYLWPTLAGGVVMFVSWAIAFGCGLRLRSPTNVDCSQHPRATHWPQYDCPTCFMQRTAWTARLGAPQDLLRPQTWIMLAGIVTLTLGLYALGLGYPCRACG
jgi:hypothetical protein